MRVSACGLLGLLSGSASSQAAEPITLHYVNRPPYAMVQSHGDPMGVVANPAAEVLKKAKIPFIWAQTPVNRQFELVKANQGLHCALGMEQTPSRNEFAKFTEPLYISQPLVAIMNPKIKEKKGVTLVELLSKYSILVKENYTLGDEITALVMKSPNKQLTVAESSQMVQMIAQGHADFMMISNDEVEYYLQQGILKPKEIRLMELPDAQKRFTRRMMCSKSVDDGVISELNKAIKALNVKAPKIKSLNALQ